MTKEHYATRYKRTIHRQAKIIDKYYKAIREIKQLAGNPNGSLYAASVDGSRFPDIQGNEESMPVNDVEALKRLIQSLPEIV